MCKRLLLALVLVFSATTAHAQDTTARAVHLRDSTQSRVDSLVRVALEREHARCSRGDLFTEVVSSTVAGGVIGAMIGAIPAALLSLLKYHDAARAVLWTPTVGGSVLLGSVSWEVGKITCHQRLQRFATG